jgi:hypothetical protein
MSMTSQPNYLQRIYLSSTQADVNSYIPRTDELTWSLKRPITSVQNSLPSIQIGLRKLVLPNTLPNVYGFSITATTTPGNTVSTSTLADGQYSLTDFQTYVQAFFTPLNITLAFSTTGAVSFTNTSATNTITLSASSTASRYLGYPTQNLALPPSSTTYAPGRVDLAGVRVVFVCTPNYTLAGSDSQNSGDVNVIGSAEVGSAFGDIIIAGASNLIDTRSTVIDNITLSLRDQDFAKLPYYGGWYCELEVGY